MYSKVIYEPKKTKQFDRFYTVQVVQISDIAFYIQMLQNLTNDGGAQKH